MSKDEGYTFLEMAKLLKISKQTLKNRLSAGKNHPPYLPGGVEFPFPKDEYVKWCKSKLVRETKAA